MVFIENIGQLEKYFLNPPIEVYLEIIPVSSKIHPTQNALSAIYLRDVHSEKNGIIINIHHPDLINLDKDVVVSKIKQINTIYSTNKKEIFHYFYHKNIHDQLFYINGFEKHRTQPHKIYQNTDIIEDNHLIPIVKHFESCEENFKFFKEIGFIKEKSLFLNKESLVFNVIESNGIKVNQELFKQHFNKDMGEYVYTQYNLFTTTSRPSNSFGGINYAALKKTNNERESFIPRNDIFIEMDISAYHPTLLSHLLGYDFPTMDIHQYFANLYGVDYDKAKQITFQQTYGAIREEYKHLEFFQLLTKFKEELWEKFENEGSIECPISLKIFKKDELEDMNPAKLLNYLLQALETATNVEILWEVIKLLKNKNTKIVLYTYDSILLDVDKTERKTIKQIADIFTNKKLNIKYNTGVNYNFTPTPNN